MENPLELPAPDDPIERVHTFARDLAYGAVNDLWSSIVIVAPTNKRESWNSDIQRFGGQRDPFLEYIEEKWAERFPRASLMMSFEYLDIYDAQKNHTKYYVTQKAFTLLEQPVTSPTIFVSYKRDQSSALSLLIESRIKIADSGIGVFIDKELAPGDQWHGRLEKEVRERRFFVCLLGPLSLGSEYVRREIEWALDDAANSDKVIIPICHNGYHFDAELAEDQQKNTTEITALVERLRIHNAIVINPEGAEQYELAIIKLLNRLGYSNI